MRRVHLLGVPFNSAGRTDGVARAPAALRRVGLVERLRAAGVDIVDVGDVELGPTDPTRDPASGLIAPGALTAMIRSTRTRVEAILERGGFPLVLGGDCPILLGCLGRPDAASRPGLLFIDGHEDAWPPGLSTTGEAADMELGFALGRTLEGLRHDLVSEFPLLDPDGVVILGPRDERELAEAGVASIGEAFEVVHSRALTATVPDAIAGDAASRLARRGPWWLHVDLDVLSTESLGAVDYRQPDGLGWVALSQMTRRALLTPGVMGWDVTIYNPDLDPAGTDAQRITRYIAESLGSQPLPSIP